MDYNHTSTVIDSVVVEIDGGTTSDAIDIKGSSIVGLVCPSGVSGTSMTFQGTVDDVNYYNVYDESGSQKSVTIAASRYIALNPNDYVGIHKLKMVSSATETSIDFQLVVRPFA